MIGMGQVSGTASRPKTWRAILAGLLCILWILSRPTAAEILEPILFVVPEFPPLTYKKKDEIRGLGIERIRQVMIKVGVDYEIEVALNYARAARLVEIGQKDGFFLATRNARRDRFAQFLGPVYINRWTWFLPADSKLDPKDPLQRDRIRAASVVGTNTARWLKTNGYSIGMSPRSVEGLLKMLDGGKVDAVLLSAPVFQHALESTGRAGSDYRSLVEEEKPMGIYLSRAYLEKHPELRSRFDRAIESLAPEWR